MISFILNRFARKEEGSLSVEAVLVFPILVWAIAGTLVFFDAFKTSHISQKATYTIADMLSRETEDIDDDYLTSMHELFDFLSEESGDSFIRVTVVSRGVDEFGNDITSMEWSEGVNTGGLLDLTEIEERIPTMAIGDQLIVVQTEQLWTPAFAIGLADFRFREIAVMRPRFAPQLGFDDGSVAPTS